MMMLMVLMHGEDDADEDDDDADDDDDDDAFVTYLILDTCFMLGDFYSGIRFFDLRFRGDLVHLLLYL